MFEHTYRIYNSVVMVTRSCQLARNGLCCCTQNQNKLKNNL